IFNHCGQNLYVWSIRAVVNGPHTLASNGRFGEIFHRDAKSGAITVAISKDANGIYNGCPQLNLRYVVDADCKKLWYDLNSVNGFPFEGKKVVLEGDSCPEISWPEGVRLATDTLEVC
ncbi:hypothetical protein K469DRAFT_530981, partial [Zopfia rhizophila CBS 207.26]